VKQARTSGKSLAPDDPRLTVKYRWAQKIRKNRVTYDFYTHRNAIDYGVYNSNIDSLERAVKERLFFVSDGVGGFCKPPKPTENIFPSRLEYISCFFKEHARYASPLTKDEFLRAYVGRRRTVYEEAYNSLVLKPLSVVDSFINYFMKVEKINFTAKPNPAPRGISPRKPRYHVQLGPFIKRIEHTVYRIIDKLYGSKTIMKGKNMKQRGQIILDHWNSFEDPVAIGLDASRFDQHVSKDALLWEHSIYKIFYPFSNFFRRLLAWQVTNKGYGYCKDGQLRFNIKGCRMSGDMNTALGNCLLMACMLHSFCVHAGLSKFRAVNDGDDCVLFMERKELHKIRNLARYFLEFGFTMKQEPPVDVLEKIEFCQARPIRTSLTECVMVRDTQVCFAKDSISTKPLTTMKLAKRWSRAIGLCGLSLTSGIPVAQEFYQAHVRSAGNVKELKNDPTQDTGMFRLSEGMRHQKYAPVSQFARYSYWRAFGVEPAKQIALEQRLKSNNIEYVLSRFNNLQLLF